MKSILSWFGTVLLIVYVFVLPILSLFVPSGYTFREGHHDRDLMAFTFIAGAVLLGLLTYFFVTNLRRWRAPHGEMQDEAFFVSPKH